MGADDHVYGGQKEGSQRHRRFPALLGRAEGRIPAPDPGGGDQLRERNSRLLPDMENRVTVTPSIERVQITIQRADGETGRVKFGFSD